MSVCTFFGHRDCPIQIRPKLKSLILSLIEKGVNEFYVGDKGSFDLMAAAVLREIHKENPAIHYAIVLAYLQRSTVPSIKQITPRLCIRRDWKKFLYDTPLSGATSGCFNGLTM